MQSKSFFFLFLIALLTLTACGEADPRRELFKKDAENLNGVVLSQDDTLSESLSQMFNLLVNEDLKPEKNSYLTRISDDGKRLLVLIKMPKLKKAKKESRAEVVEIVQSWKAITPSIQSLDLYLGVKGKVTWMVTKTPGQATESSLIALSSDLYDFYGPLSDFKTTTTEE